MVDKLGINKSRGDGRWKQQWVVKSFSSTTDYIVSLDWDGMYHCGCRGWTSHFPRVDCKHIVEVRNGGGRSITEAVIDRMRG